MAKPDAAPRRWTHWIARSVWLAWWLVVAAAMVRDWLLHPYAPGQGNLRYGRNDETALRDGLLMTVVELALVHVLVPSWTLRAPLWRPLAGTVVLAPWLLFSAVIALHNGGIVSLHLVWVLGLTAGMLVLTLARGVQWVVDRDDRIKARQQPGRP
jgi:hypothetical protein